jgi:hypothetical protein
VKLLAAVIGDGRAAEHVIRGNGATSTVGAPERFPLGGASVWRFEPRIGHVVPVLGTSTLRWGSPDAEVLLDGAKALAQARRLAFLQGELRWDTAGRTHQCPCGRGLVLMAIDEDRRIGRILDDAADLRDCSSVGNDVTGTLK